MKNIIIIQLLSLPIFIMAEGYICPYTSLGYDGGQNELLYDYYNDVDGSYWTRMGETGWQSVTDYCKQKGDLSLHADAGEWKCNDSKGICKWSGTDCLIDNTRNPDCEDLCKAVIDGKGPDCLGNCPNGQQSNMLYDQYCQATTKPAKTKPAKTKPAKTKTTKKAKVKTVTVTRTRTITALRTCQ